MRKAGGSTRTLTARDLLKRVGRVLVLTATFTRGRRTVAFVVRTLDCMSAMREELHHLVDELPEAELRPALELIRGRVGESDGGPRDLPFFASFEAEPDLAERAEEILEAELGR
jgi:hypothetical protein